jgi:hypothetical protein
VRLVASIPVGTGVLVVVGDRFSPASVEAIRAVAGQASLALRRPESGYASELRRSS